MPDDSLAVEVVTFGCRLNACESEIMRQNALAAGLSDTIIVNTCAVTAEAERQARQSIRRLRREHGQARIIITGCAAEVNAALYTAMPEVDHVIGNGDKLRAEAFIGLQDKTVVLAAKDKADVTDVPPIRGFEGLARAFVQVQQGCDHRCTFCIIPYGRGSSRSVPIGDISRQVQVLVAEGYREIVFSGVDLTAYGADLPSSPSLGQMIRRVLALNPDLPWLRLSSVDLAEVDDDLWRLIESEPRLLPHLHLSMQAGDDMILKRMKRRHSASDIINFCQRARQLRPDIVFGADVIAGFPTEDDTMFANTVRTIEDAGITWLHVFPYSPRHGTPAALMPQVPRPIIKARAATLRRLGAESVARHLSTLVGQRLDVLVEQTGVGRTKSFASVDITDGDPPIGHVVSILCTGNDGKRACGRVL